MSSHPRLLTVLSFLSLFIYLFVSAPPPMSEEMPTATTIPIERVLAMVESENDVVRALWTKEIVEAGKKVGLEFNENWRDRGGRGRAATRIVPAGDREEPGKKSGQTESLSRVGFPY